MDDTGTARDNAGFVGFLMAPGDLLNHDIYLVSTHQIKSCVQSFLGKSLNITSKLHLL